MSLHPLRWLLPALLVGLLAGCGQPSLRDDHQERPVLSLEQYFNGPLSADGIVFDRNDKVIKTFHVDLVGSWSGDSGTLDEHFVYSDGELQHRVWSLRRLADADGELRYSGSAPDIVGTALGRALGNTLRWNYTLALPVDGRVWHVQMDDRMYQLNAGVLINRTVMRKFGIRLATIVISFHKP